ncbi:hypothetical protein OXX59_003346 [Metschnikowia pulcherrima]
MNTTPQEALDKLSESKRPTSERVCEWSQAISKGLPCEPPEIHTIAIIGHRGVGKSTLALMASADLGFAYVDTEKCVSEYTGKPEAVYSGEVSADEYYELQFTLVTRQLLANKHRSQVVVMPSTVVHSARLMSYLRSGRFSLVINIECEEERILRYLNYQGSSEDGLQLVRQKLAMYRSVATHDFFNCFSDGSDELSISVGAPRVQVERNFFVLKPIQRDFSRFLIFLIRGPEAAWAYTGNLHLHSRFNERFSNCLSVQFPTNVDEITNLDLVGVDHLNIDVDMISFIKANIQSPALELGGILSRLRRISRSSTPISMSICCTSADVADFVGEYSSLSDTEDDESLQIAITDYYLTFLGSAARLGFDYLCVDMSLLTPMISNVLVPQGALEEDLQSRVFEFLKSFSADVKSTQVIGTYSSEDPLFWERKVEGALELAHKLGVRILRLTSVATKVSDNHLVVQFRARQAASPRFSALTICAYNRGNAGVLSRVLNQYLTPIVAHETDDSSQFTALSLQRTLISTGLTPRLKFYVLGSNVSTSASPILYAKAFEAIGLSHEVQLYECSDLKAAYESLTCQPSFGGAAILMPFKASILDLVDDMSNHVKIIGALNTIVPQRSLNEPDKINGIHGENTDWLGVKIALANNMSPINSANEFKSALVLGAGGMARSAIYALIQLGFKKIYLYNRTRSRAEELAEYYNCSSPMLPSKAFTTQTVCDSQRALMSYQVIVTSEDELQNGTMRFSRNMFPVSIISCIPSLDRSNGQPVDLPIHSNWFASNTGGTLLETGYVPIHSTTLEKAEKLKHKGWMAVNGLTWLLCQIIAQFEMFTGKQAPVAVMKMTADNLFAEATEREFNGLH